MASMASPTISSMSPAFSISRAISVHACDSSGIFTRLGGGRMGGEKGVRQGCVFVCCRWIRGRDGRARYCVSRPHGKRHQTPKIVPPEPSHGAARRGAARHLFMLWRISELFCITPATLIVAAQGKAVVFVWSDVFVFWVSARL